MKEDEIRERFKQVAAQVDTEAKQLEQDVRNKSAVIRDETIKKVASAISSR